MNSLSKLHNLDLSLPSKTWLEMLFKVPDLNLAMTSQEGPKVFFKGFPIEKLFDDSQSAICLSIEGSKTPHFFNNSKYKTIQLSKIPEDWSEQVKFHKLNHYDTIFLFLENPMFASGHCMALIWMQKLLEEFLPTKKQILIVDESLSALQWDPNEEIGRALALPQKLQMTWEIYIAWRLPKLISTNSDDFTLWPNSPSAQLNLQNNFPAHASPLTWRLLQRDLFKEDETLRRRHLALRNLKTLADKFRPLIEESKVKIPYWPLAGAWIEIEILKDSWFKSQILAKELKQWGLSLQKGQNLTLSYLHETRDFEQNMTELVEILQKTP